MTATWTDIPDSRLEPGKPARSVDALALRDNPIAIAERATDAPVVQVPVLEKLTAASGNWPWPDGVTAATFWIQAAGGGASVGATVATDGGDSSITYNSVTTTSEGGDGGASGVTTTPGGNSGGGDFSITGKYGRAAIGGDSFFGYGGVLSSYSPVAGGGGGGDQAGGGGEMVRKRVVKVDGLNTVAYTVGQGGAGANGGQAGAAGFILVEC